MRLIVILALITLLSLPVLAVEPVYLDESFGRQWLNDSANANQGLGTWGNLPLANYYPYYQMYPYSGNYFHLAKLSPEIVPYYGNWRPYTLFDTGNYGIYPYSGNYFHLAKLSPEIVPYYGNWMPYTLFDTSNVNSPYYHG